MLVGASTLAAGTENLILPALFYTIGRVRSGQGPKLGTLRLLEDGGEGSDHINPPGSLMEFAHTIARLTNRDSCSVILARKSNLS